MSNDPNPLAQAVLGEVSRQQTAKKAAAILQSTAIGFVTPSRQARLNLLIEFARRNLVIYGKAFDVVKLAEPVDLEHPEEIRRKFNSITICEIKATSRPLPPDFKGYFFALTTAELLVAQNLKHRFRFVFVNTTTSAHIELSLTEVLARARGVYPTWSISF